MNRKLNDATPNLCFEDLSALFLTKSRVNPSFPESISFEKPASTRLSSISTGALRTTPAIPSFYLIFFRIDPASKAFTAPYSPVDLH